MERDGTPSERLHRPRRQIEIASQRFTVQKRHLVGSVGRARDLVELIPRFVVGRVLTDPLEQGRTFGRQRARGALLQDRVVGSQFCGGLTFHLASDAQAEGLRFEHLSPGDKQSSDSPASSSIMHEARIAGAPACDARESGGAARMLRVRSVSGHSSFRPTCRLSIKDQWPT